MQVEKTIFVVFFSGEQARTKILKICEAFGANCYPVSEDVTKQRQIIREVSWLDFISCLEEIFSAQIDLYFYCSLNGVFIEDYLEFLTEFN